jgi:hypothetical protein
MRYRRQAVWVWVLVVGALWSGGGVTTRRAGLQAPGSREPQRLHSTAAPPLQVVAAVDDDPSDAVGPGRGRLRPALRAPRHPVVVSHAPLAERNRPVLTRLKLPSPGGDDLPAH